MTDETLGDVFEKIRETNKEIEKAESQVLINNGCITNEQYANENLAILEKRLGLDGILQQLTNLEIEIEKLKSCNEIALDIVSHDGTILAKTEERVANIENQIFTIGKLVIKEKMKQFEEQETNNMPKGNPGDVLCYDRSIGKYRWAPIDKASENSFPMISYGINLIERGDVIEEEKK